MKELICIGCPKGCHLRVDEEKDYEVTGNGCPIGAQYGKTEVTNPTRVLTSTVRITGAAYRRCPVRTAAPVPKGKLFDVMSALNGVTLASPVKPGDVALENAANTGVNVIVTKGM